MLAGVTLVIVLPWLATRRSASESSAAATGGTGPAPVDVCTENVEALPLRGRLALTLMVGVDGDATASVTTLLAGPTRPGGVFVRGGAAIWEEALLADRPGDGLPLLVAVDDEGGRVQPMEGLLDDLASAAVLAGESSEVLRSLAAERGEALRDLGITMVLGPVVDVGGAGGIGDRSFGDTSDEVVAKAGAYAAGLRDAGILPVLKHFPGQGHADADSHEAVSTVPPIDLLRTSDLVPYDRLLEAPATGVMVGHLDVPGLTEAGVPASLSPAAVGLLRGSYEFDGLVVTDDLVAMQAVRSRFTVPEAAERALAAGADVLLLSQPADVEAVLDQLEEAVNLGRVPDRRLEAALDRVTRTGCPP